MRPRGAAPAHLLVAVAEEQHVTRAAERLSIAQPAVSHQIRRLEAELGEPLFLRTPHGVQLTDARVALLPHARASVAAANSGRDAIASLRGLVRGRVTLGTIRPAPPALPRLLGKFRHEHTEVDLHVGEGHTWQLIDDLRGRKLDIAIIGLDSRKRLPDDLHHEAISSEAVVLVVHREHPLAGRRSVAITQLRNEPMVTLPADSGQRAMLDAAARDAGFPLQIIAESNDLRMLVDLVAHGVGVALVPSSAVGTSDQCAAVPLSRPRLTRRTVLSWSDAALSPAARAFLAQARERLPVHEPSPGLASSRPSGGAHS